MYGYLPPIQIRTTSPLRQFLTRMADIGEKSGAFTVERHFGALGDADFDIINFRSTKSSPHIGLGVQLISQYDVNDIIAVEVRAERWSPDDPPTYATYVAEAKALVGPLLSAYNRDANTRHRMSIARMKRLEPKLPPHSEKLFKRFALLANKSVLHPLDWGRFYEFVRSSRMRRPLYEEDMARLLMKEGFSVQYAKHIAGVYFHLCEFKHSA
jgi:hypothetical protein